MEETQSKLVFYVNGKKVVEEHANPATSLLQYLRQNLGLTGTKTGCGEGGCGACTVMVSKYDRTSKKIVHFSTVSCLVPLCAVHGLAITTVEGIGSVRKGLHPVQKRIADSHGTQCGFCTPGMVMSMYTLLRNHPQPNAGQVEQALLGNLCRCTGYRPILDGFKAFTKSIKQFGSRLDAELLGVSSGSTLFAIGYDSSAHTREVCEMGENCCRNKNNDEGKTADSEEHVHIADFKPLHPSQEPIFPPDLQISDKFDTEMLVFRSENITWYRPTTLQSLLNLKSRFQDSKLVLGHTKIGLDLKSSTESHTVLIAATHIPELQDISHTDKGIQLGGAVTIASLEEELNNAVQNYQEYQTRAFAAITDILKRFAGQQIRNMATIGGGIMAAKANSDVNSLLVALHAVVRVTSTDGVTRDVLMNDDFFLEDGKTQLSSNEVLISVIIPFTGKSEFCYGYKQGYCRDTYAIVNAGMRVVFDDGDSKVKELYLVYGGLGKATVMAIKTMKRVVKMKWDDNMLSDVCSSLAEELSQLSGSGEGMEQYRQAMALSLFFKFYIFIQSKFRKMNITNVDDTKESVEDVSSVFRQEPTKSYQLFQEVSPEQHSEDPVGRPIRHVSAQQHATGETVYIDDMPQIKGELFMTFVRSEKAHALIKSVDIMEALTMPGVQDYVSHSDVPGSNLWGIVTKDEELFASNKVLCQGQIIGAVLADSREQAQKAAKCVKVEYEELQPLLTIKEAIDAGSYFLSPLVLKNGDVDAGFKQADHVIEGECHIAGQSHFYFETQSVIAFPKGENDEMEMFVSTQNPTLSQTAAAVALDIPSNKITVCVKKVGSGFGGKESRAALYSTCAAVAAHKLQKSVRCVLTREEDMVLTGTSPSVLAKYKVGFSKAGKVLAMKLDMFFNTGMSLDLLDAVRDRTLFHCNNAYNIPNIHATAYLCKTNLPSSTAFRGFGIPQAVMVADNWITEIATYLDVPSVKVRELNMYQEGDFTIYNQELSNCHVQKCWDECIKDSDYVNRRESVDTFNRNNRWKKRGITVVPLLFGMNFEVPLLNQAGALVHVYTDGSVLLTHGGVEIGQGIHTKMIQVASRVLGIPASKILISETGTNTVANTSPTAGSVTSDLNGMAVMYACEKIMKRLETIRKNQPNASWEEWIITAYIQRVNLSATGYYKLPGQDYDYETNSGVRYTYFSYGAACSEVEIDCLTGDHQILRTDIVMDVGQSLNPAIDIGQIEGAFVQGCGMVMLEEPKVSPSGYLHTRGPASYKIPTVGSIPAEFNVSLLKGSVNTKAVYSSKGIGEPSFLLAISVFYAVKEAIMSARADAGHHGTFRLDSPATPERVRLACEDQFTKMIRKPEEGKHTPWHVGI